MMYVITADYGSEICCVVTTQADAEEFILSLAEEDVYNYYTECILQEGISYEDFIDRWRNWKIQEGCSYRNYKTLYGYLLEHESGEFSFEGASYLM